MSKNNLLYVTFKNVAAETAWSKFNQEQYPNSVITHSDFKKIFKMGFKKGYKSRKLRNWLLK